MHNQGVSDTISLDPYIYILVAFVTCFLSLLYSAAGIFSVPWDIIYLQKETFSIRKLVGCRRYLFFVVVFPLSF